MPSFNDLLDPCTGGEQADGSYEEVMIQRIEILTDIQIKYPIITPATLASFCYSIQGRAAGTIAKRVVMEVRLHKRL